jgi:hypothetical protein
MRRTRFERRRSAVLSLGIYACGCALIAVGLYPGAPAAVAVGACAVVISGAEMLQEERARQLWQTCRLYLRLPQLRRRARRLLAQVQARADEVGGLCERFAARYPLYIRLPYRWEERQLVVQPGTLLCEWDERRVAAPRELRDFARLLGDQLGQSPDVWATVLLHNAIVFERTRRQLRAAVFQDTAAAGNADVVPDVAALFERLCRHPDCNSVLVREAFVGELAARGWVDAVIAHESARRRVGSITQAVDQGLRAARCEIGARERVRQLAAALTAMRTAPDPVGSVTCEQLAVLCQTDLEAAVDLVRAVLVPAAARLADGPLQAAGCFLADADGMRVLVALDPCTDVELPQHLVQRTHALRAAHQADTALILALTPLNPACVALADRLQVLILPRVEFAALLSQQVEGVAQLIERSLVQSRTHVDS